MRKELRSSFSAIGTSLVLGLNHDLLYRKTLILWLAGMHVDSMISQMEGETDPEVVEMVSLMKQLLKS